MSEGSRPADDPSLEVGGALREAIHYLDKHGIEGAARDAGHLMAHVLGVDPSRLILMAHDAMTAKQHDRFRGLVRRRAGREPVSHLTGQRLFYGRRFKVGPDVLDPRPETETLIEAALERPFDTVLDIGVGSGAILVTLLAERLAARGVGTELSPQALNVARENARRLGVEERCAFLQGDWFAGVGGQFDLIVSNPPYIAAEEMEGLAPELRHEPRMALTDEGDGLGAYRAIAAGLRAHLAPGGCVLLEIGPTQGGAVSNLLREAGLIDISVLPDLDGRDRVVRGMRGENATETAVNPRKSA